ncbi:SLAM family member 8-like [Leptodactylus fuscus]|uniref:SLAM family member 8-like n=1 Tax=Leptodactylus fuscus TaxID=238119 RepID=UPI003F4EBA23
MDRNIKYLDIKVIMKFSPATSPSGDISWTKQVLKSGHAGARSVVGLLNHSVEFYHPDLSLPVVEVVWNFLTQKKTTRVVMYYKDQLSTYDPQFTNRLEVSNKGTKLRIKNLKKEDTGDYMASMTLTNGEVHEVTYSLTVYGGHAGARSVVGLLNHSVEFYHPDLSLPVVEVAWNFITQNKTTKMVMYHKDEVSIYNPQFTNRLEVSNDGTKLRIKHLKKADTGVYTASMTLTDGEVHEVKYSLTVYEPVPFPTIWATVNESAKYRCNVTLHCSVPSNAPDFSYTWKYRYRDREYQLYSNGSSIQISVPPDHQDMELLCIVHNPADQKNVSIDIRNTCHVLKDKNGSSYHRYLYYLLGSLLLTALLIRMWMEGRKGNPSEDQE